MIYALAHFADATVAVREVDPVTGAILRYCDEAGNTLDRTDVPTFIGEQVFPDWALPDPVVEVQPTAPEASKVDSKITFRRRFTDEERLLIDEFNATFETLPNLTAEQKRDIRSGLEDYKATDEVNRADPSTSKMLGLYTALGLIAPGRAEEIINA